MPLEIHRLKGCPRTDKVLPFPASLNTCRLLNGNISFAGDAPRFSSIVRQALTRVKDRPMDMRRSILSCINKVLV